MNTNDEIDDEMNREIAEMILEQLGGDRFILMTGACNFVENDGDLSFCLPRGANGINRVKIHLNGWDLYDMTFGRLHGVKYTVKAQFSDIFNDMLQTVFTEQTGLQTKL